MAHNALATNYCRTDLCPKDTTHIICGNPGVSVFFFYLMSIPIIICKPLKSKFDKQKNIRNGQTRVVIIRGFIS